MVKWIVLTLTKTLTISTAMLCVLTARNALLAGHNGYFIVFILLTVWGIILFEKLTIARHKLHTIPTLTKKMNKNHKCKYCNQKKPNCIGNICTTCRQKQYAQNK